MPRKPSKYETIYVVQGNYGYGHGWEDLDASADRKDAQANYRLYRENEPSASLRFIKRRVLRDGALGGFLNGSWLAWAGAALGLGGVAALAVAVGRARRA